jgi:hypothetical protein
MPQGNRDQAQFVARGLDDLPGDGRGILLEVVRHALRLGHDYAGEDKGNSNQEPMHLRPRGNAVVSSDNARIWAMFQGDELRARKVDGAP